MKKALFVSTILLISLVLYIFYSKESPTKMQVKSITVPKTNETNTPLINSSTQTYTTNKNSIETDIEESYPNNKSYSIFEEIDIDSLRLTMKPMKDVEPIAALQMKRNIIKEMEVGDTIVLPSIEGNSYELIVTHKKVSSRGNVTIDGNFMENGINYSAIMTEGHDATFISMNTPEGTYEMELLHGTGYIYANSDINKAKIDYSKLDEISK